MGDVLQDVKAIRHDVKTDCCTHHPTGANLANCAGLHMFIFVWLSVCVRVWVCVCVLRVLVCKEPQFLPAFALFCVTLGCQVRNMLVIVLVSMIQGYLLDAKNFFAGWGGGGCDFEPFTHRWLHSHHADVTFALASLYRTNISVEFGARPFV